MEVTIIKQDHTGREVWRYYGHLIQDHADKIMIEAFFDQQDMAVHGLNLEKGDRFVEIYFRDRWYNIYKIYNQSEGHLKCWYCNISYPAEFQSGILKYRDLALDLLVTPSGQQHILDETEFLALDLSPKKRAKALAALTELQTMFAQKFNIHSGKDR
jgi:predicted RNA-binding protein associated with RNAse of E/G family